ncbi:MAG: hypothetical protein JNM10_19645 [Planctomycetia bacterium]|nr:hypothetical protein [Planctomycetia bacterium]
MTAPAPATDDRDPGFSRRGLVVLVLAVAVSFGVFVAFTVFGAGTSPSAGADVDSQSALGHRPFVELLRRLGIPVTVGRWFPGRRAHEDALLVVAEPDGDADFADGSDALSGRKARLAPTFLVLPKRRPQDGEARDGWVAGAELLEPADVGRVLLAAGIRAQVVRVDAFPSPDLGELGVPPTLVAPAQLLDGATDFEVLVGSRDGMLLGVRDDGDEPPLVVLSDPDVLAAHGLVLGRNAEFVVGWLERFRPRDGVVIVDAASQGRARAPSLARELFGWPLVLASATALVAALAAIVAGVRRFGAPRPPASPFQGRTKPVVAHAAELALDGGHTQHALERYLAMTVAAVARDVHAPPGLSPGDQHAWLDRATAARGGDERVDDLVAAVRAEGHRAPLATARRIHAWRSTFAHGPDVDP